ncbi:MAG: lycopene cyclase family protein [Myxococcota bacterium]
MFAHAILGGGVAASRLATRLAEGGHGPVLLIDPMAHDPRTLALFADPADSWWEPFVLHRWLRIAVRAGGRRVVRRPAYPYVIVRAQALRERAYRAVQAAEGKVHRGTIASIKETEASVRIRLEDGSVYQASWVYDARLDEPRHPSAMRQTFAGVWVETESPTFDPDETLLMDFDPFAAGPPAESVRFAHALPTSDRHALVMAVSIGPGRPTLPVGTWLPRVLPTTDLHTVTAYESGSLPLFTVDTNCRLGPRCLRIGYPGGLLKTPFGDAVQRIDEDARAIVAAVAETGAPAIPKRRHAVQWRWLDRVLLSLVTERGQQASQVFMALFQRQPIDAVIDFLEERATCSDVLGLMVKLPRWGWFASAGWHQLTLPSTPR